MFHRFFSHSPFYTTFSYLKKGFQKYRLRRNVTRLRYFNITMPPFVFQRPTIFIFNFPTEGYGVCEVFLTWVDKSKPRPGVQQNIRPKVTVWHHKAIHLSAVSPVWHHNAFTLSLWHHDHSKYAGFKQSNALVKYHINNIKGTWYYINASKRLQNN